MAAPDAITRIRRALALLSEQPGARVAAPASRKKLAQLEDEAGPLAPGLADYFSCCDGVTMGDDPGLFSVARMLEIDTPGFYAISEDFSGNYDLVARDYAPGAGAVVFFDHEPGGAEYLIASSVAVYVDLWAQRLAAAAAGKTRAPILKWPFDAAFMAKHDPEGARLARSRSFKGQLGEVPLAHVDRKGKQRARVGVNPFTGERIELPAPPKTRSR